MNFARLLMTACLSLSVAAPALAKPCVYNDAWVGQDKTKHFISGAALGAAATMASDERTALLLGTIVAVGKEIKDRKDPGHQCSLQDAIATVAGVYAGAQGMRWFISRQAGTTVVGYRGSF